jgi:hypothetical protein
MRLAPETSRARLDGQGRKVRRRSVPRTRSAVSCPSAFGLCSGSMWLSLSIVATSGSGSS